MHVNHLTCAPSDLPNHRRICIVTETYPPEVNGVALTLAHLVEGLRLRGHAVSVVRPRQRKFDQAPLHCDPEKILVPALPLPGYRGLCVGLPVGGTLQRRWTEHRPDVVYAATEGPLGWSAVAVAQRLGIPVISGFHTNFHSYCKHYRVAWLRPLIFRYLCKFHSRTMATLVPSADLRNRLQAVGLRNVNVLGRGVDSRLFTPQRRSAALRRAWHASESDLVLLSVGRVAAEKNIELAIKAYRAMERVSHAVKFVIVGDGPLRARLQKKHPDLVFSGVHTGEQLAEHYASADIFLFPSETETFGNVTLEAMASGLVVVAYDYAAARIHIRDSESGTLVPYGDSQAFVDKAAELACVPQSLDKMRRQARQYATSLDWQRVVDRFAALLMSALDQSHTAGAEVGSEAIEATPSCY